MAMAALVTCNHPSLAQGNPAATPPSQTATVTGTTSADASASSSQSAAVPVPAPAIPQLADVFVDGIELRNPDSSRVKLGSGLRYVTDDSLTLFTQYYNETGKEILKLYAGSTVKTKRSFKGYDISKLDKAFLVGGIRRLRTTKRFVTGKGIFLGMNQHEIETILGQPTQTENESDGSTTVRYSLTDAASPFLQYYKSAEYTGAYKFKHCSLVEVQVAFK